MRLTATALIATLGLAAGVAMAADATDPTAKARQELMDTIGASMKVLGDMAGGKAPFDAAAATAAKDALVAAGADIPAKFETAATDPASKAKPEIWTDFAGFTAKATTFSTAAGALDVTSADTIKATLGGIGGTCKDCHSAYRN
jgi:cytochrome c556